MDPSDIVAAIMERPGPVRLVAIDGRGGAGKSTFEDAHFARDPTRERVDVEIDGTA